MHESVPEGSTKPCRACRAEIPDAATVCRECKAHQNRWRDTLVFGSSIAGLIALAVSGAVFTATTIQRQIDDLTWQERLSLVSLSVDNAGESIVLANTGDGSVFVTRLVIRWYAGSTGIDMQTPIEKQRFVVRNRGTPGSTSDTFLASRSGRMSRDLAVKAGDRVNVSSCLTAVFLDQQNGALEQVVRHYARQGYRPVRDDTPYAEITAASATTGKREVFKYPLVAVVAASTDPKCAAEIAPYR